MPNMLVRAVGAIKRRSTSWVAARLVKFKGVTADKSVVFLGMPVISLASTSVIGLGRRVVLVSQSEHTALGVSRPCILRTMRPGASILIGDDCGLSGAVICAALSIEIGSNCLLGAEVMVVDNDFHSIAPEGRRYNRDQNAISAKPVVIEDDVFIGARSIVLKGVRIGKGSVVGAGSVVVKSLPSGVIAAGNPAKIVGNIPATGTSAGGQ